ncbi:hypothetical protein [Zongyangia hominis]|uniref:RNA polymerase sigma-70 region 4 domain-containing protein n=1 Tax=Zongyangia hominis TaxID=2763677 RepID=A0A926IAV5_9FIRM|nr:hypothetical protein [Zongyangia hominis]MBC8570601.1 hypothetical protein [Zongyangia hominis]
MASKLSLDFHLYDKASFDQFAAEKGEDNARQLYRAKKILHRVMKEELTPLQLEYMTRFYFGKETMTQIAQDRGINKSSVSRVIRNGRERIYRVLKYLDLRN